MNSKVPHLADYPAGPQRDGVKPLISLVTAVRNGERTLPRTIDSIRAQALSGLEYIVVDADSTDATMDVVRANADIVTISKSECDRGISDGFNKGIALSRGTYVALVNADDWLSPGQLAAGVAALERSGADFAFGDLTYHDAAGRALYRVTGDAGYARRIAYTMPALNHPTVIVRRTAYESHGLFDLGLRVAMDYELLLRLHRAGCRGVYEPRMFGHMALDGVSDRQGRAALREVRDISIRHGFSRPAAHLRYWYALLKGRVRRITEALLPRGVSRAVRRIFNHDIARAG